MMSATCSPGEGAQRRNPGWAVPDYGALRLPPGYGSYLQ
jgi:hypothetical protein